MSAQWDRLVESDGFQRLPPDERARVRNNYFEKVLAPRIPPEKLGTALKRWDSYRPEDKRNPKAVELMGDAGYAEAPTRSRLPVPLRADLLDDVQPGEIQNDAQGRQAVIKNGQAFPMSAGFDQTTAAPQTIARAQPEAAAPDPSDDALRGAFGKASPDKDRPISDNLATDAAMSLGARAAMLPADLAVGTADLAARGARGGFRVYDALGIPGAGWVAEQITPIKDQQALQDTYVRGRRAIQDAVSRNLSLETQEQQQAVSAAMDAAADGSGSLLEMVNQAWAGASAMTTNPRALSVTLAETVPDLFVAGGFARAAAAPLFKKTYDLHLRAGFNPRAAALIAAKRTSAMATGAAAGSEAVIAANMSADQAAAAIDDVSDEELAAVSPRFASLLPQVGGDEARRMMKADAMDTAAGLSAGITAVAGRLTGASSQIGKIATRGIVPETVARSVPSAVARGVGAQGAEEFIQEGGDAFAQNRAAIDSGADPERDPMRGVMAQAGAGAVAGAALGGPIGAAGNIGTGEPLKPEPTKPRMSLREYMEVRSGKKKAAPPVAPKAEPAKSVVVEGVTLTQQVDEDGTPYWTAPGVERAFTAPEEFAEWRAEQNADAAVTAEIKTLLERETPSGEISPAEVAAASNGQPGDQTLGGPRALPADEGRVVGDGGADAGMPAPGMRPPAFVAEPQPEPAPALTTPPTGGVSRSKAPKPETAEDIEANERRYLMKMLRGTGIDIGERTDITREQPRTAARMAPGLFRKGGRTIDDVATDLYNAGYISETDFNDVDGGIQAARDLIYNAITKSEPVLSIEARDRWIALRNDEAMTAQDAADEVGVDPFDFGAMPDFELSSESKPDVIDYALVEQANEADEAAVEMAARQFENDDAGFMRAVQEIIDGRAEAARQADPIVGSGEASEGGARGSGQAVATGNPATQTAVTPGPDTGAFSLAPQTEASRQKDEARVAQAEAQQQAQRQQAEMRAQSEREAGDFTLTGSDRPADVGAARGQTDIFAPRMDEGSKAETPVAAKSQASESRKVDGVEADGRVSDPGKLPFDAIVETADGRKFAVSGGRFGRLRGQPARADGSFEMSADATVDFATDEMAADKFPSALKDPVFYRGERVGQKSESTPAPQFTRPQIDDATERAVQKVRILVAGKDVKDLRVATGVKRLTRRSELEAEAVRQAQENPLAVADALGIELAPEVRAPLEQLYGQTPNTPAPAVADAQAGRLDDFGEKLGGARKDESPSLDREITDADIAAQPLSKIWPKSEIDAVEDKFIAALLTAARAEIPAKPRKGYKLTRWVQTVQQMRGMARTVQAVGRGKIDDLIKETPSLGNWYSKVRLMEAIDRDQWSRIGGVVEAPDAYTYIDGERVNQPAVMVDIDGRKSWFQGFGDIDGALPRIREKLAGTEPAASKMQFEIRIRRKDGKVFINKKGDSEQRALREFDNPKQARAFINDNYDDLVAEWEGVKDRDNVRKSDVRRSENRPRTGADRRNGRDADEAMFSEAFGFRGVEFGNWLQQGTGQKDRQGMLNEVYDALMDLSDVVGVPPRAMSLGGTLGLGLGSRGKGGKAAAHFEPDTLVINLTKTKGAGSLAHEWFHALDNYFARKRDGGESFQGTNFITYKPEPLMVRKDRSRLFPPMTRGQLLAKRRALGDQTDNFNDDKWERDPSAPQGVRPEVEERFADLVEALNESPMAARARLLDSDKKAYWSQIIERGARSFENYVISKMMEKGYQNDFLANVVALEAFTRDKGRYPYLMPEEVAPVAQAFDALFETIETQQDGDNVVLFSRDGQSAADQTQTAEFKRWFGDSKVVDADGKPLVVYHGSPNAGFTVFDEDRAGSNTQNARAGFFFTESKKNAETYSGRSTEAKLRDDFDPDYDGEAGVYPVYLSIHDPLEVDFGGRNWDGALEGEYDGHESVPEIVDQAKAAGYDGVIIRNVTDEGRFGQGYHWGNETYVAFRPEQVKSATGNRGTFDPADPDISRLQSGTVPASNRPDAPEWDRSQVEKLNGILARQAGQDVPLRAVDAPRAMRDLSQTMETLLGRKAVFFESNDPRAPAGVYASGGVLFVNADARQPLRHVLGHEFTHSLEGPNAELHAILKARILEMAKDGAFPGYEARLKGVYERDGLPALSRAKVENEFVADVMGSVMSDPKVLFDLKQRMEPNAFKRLMNRLRFWIEKMMSRLRREDMRQSQFAQRTMRDLQSVKTLVADVLQATAEGQLQADVGYAVPAFSNDGQSAGETFYSALTQNVEAFKQPKASPQMWKGIITNLSQKGVKKEEVEWSGVIEWLDQQQGPVTKEALTEYLRQNEVRVEEVELGAEASAELNSLYEQRGALLASRRPVPPELESQIRRLEADQQATKYGDYQTPGGDNYRELLLTLPTKPLSENDAGAMFYDRFARRGGDPGWADLSQEQRQSIIDDMPSEARKAPASGQYRSSHFDIPNVLAHVRFNERYDAEGKRVLFIEEVQSDWHQEGRKKGYKAGPRDTSGWTAEKQPSGRYSVKDENGLWMSNYSAASEQEAIAAAAETRSDKRPPDAPFKQSWPMLSMKRMIRYASESGFDRVAWLPGEQQAARYDLGKQIESIVADEYEIAGDRQWKLKVETVDGRDASPRTYVTDAELADHVGKELADKIVADGGGEYSGLDLKVGGEGMKAFYDRELRNEVGKYVKKWGSKVGQAYMDPTNPATRSVTNDGPIEALALGAAPAWSIDITPQMRDAAMEGQPLFARNGQWGQFPDAAILSPPNTANAHRDYAAAKAGDTAAAYRLARDLLTPDRVEVLRQALRGASPVIVPVLAVEAAGNNRIPLAAAEVLGDALGLEVSTDIMQAKKVSRGGSDGWHRIAVQPTFDGEVRRGADYLILDDTLAQGGTLAALKTHIEQGGGRVVLASALTGKQYSSKLAPSEQTLNQLREQYGELESWWRSELGYGFVGLTESEARYILKSGQDADGIRDRIVAARNEAGERRNPTDDRPRQGESDVTQNPPDGGFSDSGDDVKFSRQDQTSTDPDDISTLLPPNWGGWEIWHRKVRADNRRALNHNLYPWFINRFSEVERAVNYLKGKGVAIPDERDPGSLEKTFYGRTQTRLDDLKDTTKALFKVMNKSGVSFKQASDYLYALHAEERNAAIAERNSMFPDGGSGMTNRQAKKILAEVAALPQEQRDALAEVSRVMQAINRQKLNLMREAGLISAQQYQDLTTGYQHYVPLKSVVDPEEEGQGTGNGFDQRSTVIREAFGRASRAEDPLAVALLDAQKTFVRAEKNRVGRAVYNLILETSGEQGLISGPAGDYWRVMTPDEYPKLARKVKVRDEATGEMRDDVQYVPSMNDLYRRDEIFMARVDGALVVMEFQNKRLAKQLKNMAGEQLSWVLRGIGAATRLYGRTLTMYNPEFALPNFVRDVQTAFLNAFGADMKDPKGFAFDVMKNLRAGLVGAVRGKNEGWLIEGSPLYREFLESGGTTGAYGLTGVDDIKAEFQRLVDQQRKGAPNIAVQGVKGGVSGFFNMLERYNEIFENTTRLAIYKAARDRGLSKQESARLAKDTTVNFNQKGELQWPSAFYVFFNAAMQGNFAMLKAAARSKWTRRAMLGLMVAGLVESLLEGDDEEGEPLGDAAGKWSLGRELTAFVDENTFIKWPIAYGYNVPYAMGRMVGRAVRGNASPAEAVGVSLSAFMTSFMPTDTLIPSVVEPFLNVANNQTSFGSTIYRRSFGDDTYDPVAYRDYEEKALTGLMQTLHGMMGGTRFGPNWVKEAWDVDPLSASGAEALVKGYVGPQWRLVEGMVTVLAGDGPTHRNDVPVLRRFVNERSEYFYDSRFSDIARQADAALKTIKSMEDSDEPYADKFTKKQEDAIDEVLWIAKEDRKARRDIEDSPDEAIKQKWEAERDAEVRAGIRIWNDAFGS